MGFHQVAERERFIRPCADDDDDGEQISESPQGILSFFSLSLSPSLFLSCLDREVVQAALHGQFSACASGRAIQTFK